MPTWFWITLWVVLSVAAIAYFAWILLTLAAKSRGLLRAAEPLLGKLQSFQETISQPVAYQPNPDNLQDDPMEHIALQNRLKKARLARQAAKQRRLINKLIDFDFEESEFNNEPKRL